MKIRGNVRINKTMKDILDDYSSENQDNWGYLKEFDRLIDPLIISIFYGIFISKKLPPLDEEEIYTGLLRDFYVDIHLYSDLINHYLFCLWIYHNGYPDETDDVDEYREKLYYFIERIINVDYYKTVLIPYYLNQADQQEAGQASFLFRLWNSNKAGLELSNNTPEYVALKFLDAQEDFIKEIISSQINIDSPS